MGTETAIAWTDHTFNPSGKQRLALDRLRNGLIATVKSIVASVAKCDAVADDYSQFGECRKGLDVVCVEIPSAGVPAVLASEPVTQINIVAPLLVFGRVSFAVTLAAFAINERVARLASWCSLSRDRTDLRARFYGMALAQSSACFADLRKRHPFFCRIAVLLTQKSRHAAFCGFSLLHSPAFAARSGKAIVAGLVRSEQRATAPLLALSASLLATLYQRLELIDSESCVRRADLQRSFFGLGHVQHITIGSH